MRVTSIAAKSCSARTLPDETDIADPGILQLPDSRQLEKGRVSVSSQPRVWTSR